MSYRFAPRFFQLAVFVTLTTSLAAVEAKLPAIIPLPQKLSAGEGSFNLRPDKSGTAGVKIVADSGGEATGQFLATALEKSAGVKIPVVR